MDFDEILKDPKYQAAFDKKVATALETAKKKWDEDLEVKQKELEENAKLTAEEKTKKELEKLIKENNDLKANESKRAMKDKALDYIKTKGYNSNINDIIDLSAFMDEEDMQSKIDTLNSNINNAVAKGLDDKLKENGYSDLAGKGKGKDGSIFNFDFTPVKNVEESK